MHCRSCGRGNRRNAAFCDTCGTKLSRATGDVRPHLTHRDTAEEGPPSRPGRPHLPDSPAAEVFVGRQQEMEVLRAALEDVLSGRGAW
jgi:hypothetical protein